MPHRIALEPVASLRRVSDGKVWSPASETVIGRSTACTLQLNQADASKEHASLSWTGSHWEIRDLNSRNGTWVGHRRLSAGDDFVLDTRNELRFGSAEVWRVEDVEPPPLMMIRVDGEAQLTTKGSMLAVPDDVSPEAIIYRDGPDRWVAEVDGQPSVIEDGAIITASGVVWRVYLPGISERTAEPVDTGFALGDSRFVFQVSQDEEHVSLEVEIGHRRLDLKDRAHHYLLLTLARLREQDVKTGVADAECGWVYHHDLQRMLSTTRNHVNVTVHRIRKQLDEVGFRDAAACVQRRLRTGQLRFGVVAFEIRS